VTDQISVRRAGPRDVDEMVRFFNRARRGRRKVDVTQLFQSFGEQGYMLAEMDGELHAVVGWNTEDFIARIRQITIFPAKLRRTVGRAVLEVVCQSAYEGMCEVALFFPPLDASGRAQTFYRSCGFTRVSLDDLIPAWRRAALHSMPENSSVMLRKLREKRVMHPV
jgi:N-acetylglutamate synthase-like GNAT family acetyltransferase